MSGGSDCIEVAIPFIGVVAQRERDGIGVPAVRQAHSRGQIPRNPMPEGGSPGRAGVCGRSKSADTRTWMDYPATCALTYAVPSLMPGAKNDTPMAWLSAPAAVELR